MGETFCVYCDESCHLENDHQQVMVLGAVWLPERRARDIAIRMRDIKEEHGLPRDFEVKWTKVSGGRQDFYLHLLRYFFQEDDLHFRALIVPDKSKLCHEQYRQDHDTWYYKMYYDMLKLILSPKEQYRIYLDVKDTRSAAKVALLHDILCNNLLDFSRRIIERVQTVRSHEVEQLQLADLLIGAVCYANRKLATSPAKLQFIQEMREQSGYELTRSTLFREDKVNLFRWKAQENAE